MAEHEGESDTVDLVVSVGARFGRDVGVNVIGNLLTAAVVYLFGAAAGVFPRSPLLIAESSGLIVCTGGEISRRLGWEVFAGRPTHQRRGARAVVEFFVQSQGVALTVFIMARNDTRDGWLFFSGCAVAAAILVALTGAAPRLWARWRGRF